MRRKTSDYFRLRDAISGELSVGRERLRRTYPAEFVRTYWNVGRVLREMAGLEDKPSADNAALVKHLSEDFSRRDSFFYDAAKFHRRYPEAPPEALSWSHYSLLIRLDDPKRCRALERKAVREGINVKAFRLYGIQTEAKVNEENTVHNVMLKFEGLLKEVGLSSLARSVVDRGMLLRVTHYDVPSFRRETACIFLSEIHQRARPL